MRNPYASILISGALLAFAAVSTAATDPAKTSYKTTKEAAEQTYKTAKMQCESLSGNPKDVCVEEAKAARVRTVAEAEMQYKHTPKAREGARNDIADADYKVAKTKCEAKTGNEKDVCVKEAKAARIATKADASADYKTAEARIDAASDKREANYKAELEKCDAQAGPARDACVAGVKSKFNK